MFNNPGRKIKIIALVLFWLEIAGGVISAISTLSMGDEDFIPIALVILLLTFPVAWLSNIMLVAFGTLVESCEITANMTEANAHIVDQMLSELRKQNASNTAQATNQQNNARTSAKAAKYYCPACLYEIPYADAMDGEFKCPKCSKVHNKQDLIKK